MENDRKTNEQAEQTELKPYEAPQIVYREPLEAVATTCTPSPPAKGTIAVCSAGPLNS